MLLIAIAPVLWAKGAIALVAFAATIPAVRVLAGPLRKLLTGDTLDVDVETLIGKTCVTDVGEVRQNFGRALIVVDDQEHSLEVRCREGVISPRHTEVVLLEYDEEGRFFWVERADKS